MGWQDWRPGNLWRASNITRDVLHLDVRKLERFRNPAKRVPEIAIRSRAVPAGSFQVASDHASGAAFSSLHPAEYGAGAGRPLR